MMVALIMIEAKRLTCECRIDDHDCWACGRHASEFARDADGLQLAEVADKDHGEWCFSGSRPLSAENARFACCDRQCMRCKKALPMKETSSTIKRTTFSRCFSRHESARLSPGEGGGTCKRNNGADIPLGLLGMQ